MSTEDRFEAACADPDCGHRFPVAADDAWRRVACPRCGASGPAVPASVRAEAARRHAGSGGAGLPGRAASGVELLLEDLRSLHNVGSILRTADGLGVDRVLLAGVTPTPQNPRLARTALGAERTVAWTHVAFAAPLVREYVARGVLTIALETSPQAIDLAALEVWRPLLLLVGNEVAGLSSPALAAVDLHVRIPMHGAKRSLNAAVACGIALWALNAGRSLETAEVP